MKEACDWISVSPDRSFIKCIKILADTSTMATYPEHNTTDGSKCWCEPEIELVGDSRIYIHRGLQ